MPNFVTSAALVDTATKCFATAASSPSFASAHARAEWALVMVSSVVNVFEATMNSVVCGIEIAGRFLEVGTVDVRDESVLHRPVGGGGEGRDRHARTEVAPADPDVDDGFDAAAGVARPLAAPHAVGERCHPVQHRVDLGDDVDAVAR